jgi:hypothetical protein
LSDDFFDHSGCDHGPVEFWIDLTDDGLRLDLLGIVRKLRQEPTQDLRDWLSTLHILLEASALQMYPWLRRSFEDAIVMTETGDLDQALLRLLKEET